MVTPAALLALFSFCISTAFGETTVKLDYGTFIGVDNTTTKVTSFKGVRYAQPPTGELRWKAPVLVDSSLNLGVVHATSFGNSCIPVPQATVQKGISEDCLFANIYVPLGTKSGSELPVMVWIHGGGFQTGNGQSNPVPLMQHAPSPGMILVTLEYRLGQFGYLAGPDFEGSYNAGMLDQRTGLRWIQKYISEFGGDPKKVTIWGESAGAGATQFHLIADDGDENGLFRAAMGDSASLSYMPDCTSEYLKDVFDLFAGFAGCSEACDDVMECLLEKNASTIASAGTQVVDNRTSTLFVFAPCIDGTFLATPPVEAFASGKFAKVPVLFGSNTDEGANWSADLPNPAANTSEPNADATTIFNFLAGQWATLSQESFEKALDLYADFNQSISLQGQQMYGEARYICTGLMISAAAKREGLKSFQYHYDNPDQGSTHGADLTGLFDPVSEFKGDDAALFVAMQQFWTSFVTDGHPTAENTSTWTPVTDTKSGSPRILLHPGAVAMEDVTGALAERCAFWHSISSEIST
uniref:Carboxylic ester hydrolase n=1 Tax=Rhodocollybia butyracea TaxID=206335 RepID=A0A9P5UGL1_9AGAR|nr:Alpha/Beta hydrolase protein [Rhodocollybia butyracea]